MKENIRKNLTAKDEKFACAFADKIILESKETDEWYEYFDDFASLLDHPKSLVRNRALYILAANAQWDEDNHFDGIFDKYLAHVTDEKPITARQCVKALAQVGLAKPQYIPMILSAFQKADLSKYKDSMRPLIEKDMAETKKVLTDFLGMEECVTAYAKVNTGSANVLHKLGFIDEAEIPELSLTIRESLWNFAIHSFIL